MPNSPAPKVDRGKTAMSRGFLSRPLQLAFEDGVITSDITVFDYGCGRGGDVKRLNQLGIRAAGWDPAHFPGSELQEADVVNLGFVINVIESAAERAEAIRGAWGLARSALVVAARPAWEARSVAGRQHKDGIITAKGTFQKFFEQDELRIWIDTLLETKSVAAAPGIFYAFKDPRARQQVLATTSRSQARSGSSRLLAELIVEKHHRLLDPLAAWVDEHRKLPAVEELRTGRELVEQFESIRTAFGVLRRADRPDRWSDVDLGTRRKSERRFEENLEVLQPLIGFLTDRGRLPHSGELDSEPAVVEALGSIRKAYSLIRRVAGAQRWNELEESSRRDFLTYLAVAALEGRPRFSDLPEDLQYDARDFFGSYKAACEEADQLLFSLRDPEEIGRACTQSRIGKLTPEALYVHISALGRLEPVLRVYEGLARGLSGRVENATIVKLHRLKSQVSYLIYPDFDRKPHPALQASVINRLSLLHVDYRSFIDSENPPILHRKDAFVSEDYPGYEKFRKLTRQEEKAGLLGQPNIGTSNGWRATLDLAGFRLRGHRLVALKK